MIIGPLTLQQNISKLQQLKNLNDDCDLNLVFLRNQNLVQVNQIVNLNLAGFFNNITLENLGDKSTSRFIGFSNLDIKQINISGNLLTNKFETELFTTNTNNYFNGFYDNNLSQIVSQDDPNIKYTQFTEPLLKISNILVTEELNVESLYSTPKVQPIKNNTLKYNILFGTVTLRKDYTDRITGCDFSFEQQENQDKYDPTQEQSGNSNTKLISNINFGEIRSDNSRL